MSTLGAAIRTENALIEYEESVREHQEQERILKDAINLRQSITNYQQLLQVVSLIKDNKQAFGNPTDVLTGGQKLPTSSSSSSHKEPMDVINQRLRIENRELENELEMIKLKLAKFTGLDNEDNDLGLMTDHQSPGSSIENRSVSPKKTIKFGRRLTRPKN